MTTQYRTWFMGLAIVAGLAAAGAAVLVWLLVTAPLTVAQALAGGF